MMNLKKRVFPPHEAPHRLAELGFPLEGFHRAMVAGLEAVRNSPPYDTPGAPGWKAWNSTVLALRKHLLPLGFTADQPNGVSLTVNAEQTRAILVHRADDGAGNERRVPQLFRTRGRGTRALYGQLSLFDDGACAADTDTQDKMEIWVFLVHIDEQSQRVTSELALPVGIDDEGNYLGFDERIMIPEIDPKPDVPVGGTGSPTGGSPIVERLRTG